MASDVIIISSPRSNNRQLKALILLTDAVIMIRAGNISWSF